MLVELVGYFLSIRVSFSIKANSLIIRLGGLVVKTLDGGPELL